VKLLLLVLFFSELLVLLIFASPRHVGDCNIFLMQKNPEVPQSFLRVSVPFLKKFPFALFAPLRSPCCGPDPLCCPSSRPAQPAFLKRGLSHPKTDPEHSVRWTSPEVCQVGGRAPAPVEPGESCFPGGSWVTPWRQSAEGCRSRCEFWKKELSLIWAVAGACSAGWVLYVGDVCSLYFSPAICAAESPEKRLLALPPGDLSDTEAWKGRGCLAPGSSGRLLQLGLAALLPAAALPQKL